MQFRLTYQGTLLSENGKGKISSARATHKQYIRRQFHHQLKRLWSLNRFLRGSDPLLDRHGSPLNLQVLGHTGANHTIDALADRFKIDEYNFVPLITDNIGALCSIDVLYLRNGPPGSVFSAGDLDNRLKTLFDALTMPKDRGQLGDYTSPESDEIPFFCLLQDDALVTRVTAETDTLLSPVQNDQDDARVIVTVRTLLVEPRGDNIGFI